MHVVDRAKCRIVRYYDAEAQMRCDMSINNRHVGYSAELASKTACLPPYLARAV